MTENRILFAISIIFTLLLFFAANSTAQNNINCASSTCGNIRISYPFRLTSASPSCGYDDPSFELQCQNNQTIFNAGTRRYIVQDISYDYYSIRLVDPSISRANLSSCPVYSNALDDWPSMFSNFLQWHWNMPVSFIYCLAPVNSSKYVEGPFCGNRSSIFSNSSQIYSYVMEGDRTVVSDLEESCTIDKVVWTSGRRGMTDSSSLAGIYDDLAYGVELSWFRVYCGQCERTDGYCSLEETKITCKHYCVEGVALSDRSLKCKSPLCFLSV